MNARRLRRRCAARLRDLRLPVPFDIDALCARIAAGRGRPIHLRAIPGLTGVCGLWIATDAADIIFYEQVTVPPHREHIVLHELSHLLCDHYPASLSLADQARLLLPNLDPALVRRVLGRTGYSCEQEREAELLASLIRQRAHAEATVADRLRTALDGGHG
ncbi:hypothetical protein ACFQV2_25310 [Actinokineospora soli]|uniref:IrrE N-terminal-like domain-containing protein n=1 Tax=Actinokineospora soli TaxID=1048753 RepID=A0ABW2TSL1_9PSEU